MMGLNNLSSEVDVARVGSSELEAAEDEPSCCQIDERDLVRSHIVGKGAYGEVWSGLLKPEGRAVAIKIIRHGALLDEDGDLIHPEADAEFRKECAALQRFRSPHLVEFIGFGASAGSHQFIVTELMALSYGPCSSKLGHGKRVTTPCSDITRSPHHHRLSTRTSIPPLLIQTIQIQIQCSWPATWPI